MTAATFAAVSLSSFAIMSMLNTRRSDVLGS